MEKGRQKHIKSEHNDPLEISTKPNPSTTPQPSTTPEPSTSPQPSTTLQPSSTPNTSTTSSHQSSTATTPGYCIHEANQN